jgi:hypothetical protein
MKEEDIYPWKKKKHQKGESSKREQKKLPPQKRPRTEEEANKRKQRPKSDSSSDEKMGGNPKNFDYYFGGKNQRQPDKDNNPNSKDKGNPNTDTTRAQVVRIENIPPISQPLIASQKETVQRPELPEYVPSPKSAKIAASEAKVQDWIKSSTSAVSVISKEVLNLNEPPNKTESLFGYNVGYYMTAAAAAGIAALIGAAVYVWRARRSRQDDEEEVVEVDTKRSRRLHAREWRLVGEG